MTFAEATTAYGKVATMVIRQRIRRGWSVEDAFTKPLREDTNDWKRMNTRTKVDALKAYVAEGLTPAQIAPLLQNVTVEQVEAFCGNHNIGYGVARRRKDERPPEQGEREWSKSIDGKGGPNPNGVRFIDTNEDTCRWPLWDQPVGAASERLCCGQKTHRGLYCEAHTNRRRILTR